jgi:hypothetical protein
MLDQALIGSLTTGILALVSQTINKARCYIACRRDEDGNLCPAQAILCGFTDVPLSELQAEKISEESKE